MTTKNITNAAIRSAAGLVIGAGVNLLGCILLTAYGAALGVALLRELGLFERPRGER